MTSPANRDLFLRTLKALGTKDWDTFESCLADDLVSEWPYVVIEGFPTEMIGGRKLREQLEVSLVPFTGYDYRVIALHDMADPDELVAEYTSHSTYLPRNVPYSNRYVAIVEFRDGKVSRWREYVNPKIVLETMGPGIKWEEDKGAQPVDAGAAR